MKSYKCELCGSKKYYKSHKLSKKLIDDPVFLVVKCSSCGLHSLFPMPENDDLEWIYAEYHQKGDRVNVELRRQRYVYPRKINLIKRFHPDAAHILDVGAGIGGFAKVALDEGYDIDGVEYEYNQVAKAKELFGVDLYNCLLDDFVVTRNNARYDVVFLHHVVEHLRFPLSSLKSIKSVMREDGLLLLEVPNQFFQLKKIIKSKISLTGNTKKYPYNPYHHTYFFCPKTLCHLVVAAGFDVIKVNEVSSYGNIVKWYEKYIPRSVIYKMKYGWTGNIEVVAKPSAKIVR